VRVINLGTPIKSYIGETMAKQKLQKAKMEAEFQERI
jgi:hypothetical protein